MRKTWTQRDDDFLWHYYPLAEREWLISTMKRSWASLRHRASQLGIKRLYKYPPAHLGFTHSPEARAKMSAKTKREKHPNWDKHLSEETRHRISLAQKGKPRDPLSIEKMRQKRIGHRQSKETIEKRSRSLRKAYAEGRKRLNHSPGHGKGGYRVDLGHNCRSTWEANICRIFRYKGIPYSYEPTTFILTTPDGKTTSYRPDIKVKSTYIEIKGWKELKGMQKFQLFKKQYPQIRIVLIDQRIYQRLARIYQNIIPEWEKPIQKRSKIINKEVDIPA